MKCYLINTGYMKVPAEVMIRSGEQSSGEIIVAARTLLVEHDGRRILIDPGLGPVISQEQQSSYGITLVNGMTGLPETAFLSPETISDVVITHLHFDHVAGALKMEEGKAVKRFPNACYHLPRIHTLYSREPDPSETDALLWQWTEIVQHSWIEAWNEPWMHFKFVNGHTPGMAVPVITCPGFDLVFGTDLIPMNRFTGNAVSSGYDIDPELAIKEKNLFLRSLKRPAVIALFHDADRPYAVWPEGSVSEEKIRKTVISNI